MTNCQLGGTVKTDFICQADLSHEPWDEDAFTDADSYTDRRLFCWFFHLKSLLLKFEAATQGGLWAWHALNRVFCYKHLNKLKSLS